MNYLWVYCFFLSFFLSILYLLFIFSFIYFSFIYYFVIILFYRLIARSVGSIFELLLSEMLEDLVIIHSKNNHLSLRKNENWNEIYENNYVYNIDSNNIIKAKNYNYLLMNPKKKRIMIKLLAISYVMKGSEKQVKLFVFFSFLFFVVFRFLCFYLIYFLFFLFLFIFILLILIF